MKNKSIKLVIISVSNISVEWLANGKLKSQE